MFTLNEVYNLLKCHYDVRDYPEEDILACAKSGYNHILSRLKQGAENDALALKAAVAVAHYNFFILTLSADSKYESYRVGDVTVNADPIKALKLEKEIKDTALAEAAEILTDGGFFCRGY